MLRKTYLANIVVSVVCYMALWSYAPSFPQILSSVQRYVSLHTASDVFFGPLLDKLLSPRAH